MSVTVTFVYRKLVVARLFFKLAWKVFFGVLVIEFETPAAVLPGGTVIS